MRSRELRAVFDTRSLGNDRDALERRIDQQPPEPAVDPGIVEELPAVGRKAERPGEEVQPDRLRSQRLVRLAA